jgi:hypothetical protein
MKLHQIVPQSADSLKKNVLSPDAPIPANFSKLLETDAQWNRKCIQQIIFYHFSF